MSVQKRFIAGAVCPRCGEMDKLVVYQTEQGSFKECVHCDFVEKQLVQVEVNELATRVNQVKSEEKEEGVQVVTLIDPKKAD